MTEYKENKLKLSKEQILQKIRSWCAYQERSQQEVRMKLLQYQLHVAEREEIIATLIEETFLNEERFAKAFVRGKFRIKHWGLAKIKLELKKHNISDHVLQKAIKEIEADEYGKALDKLIEKKIRSLEPMNEFQKRAALFRYLYSKGYESDLIQKRIEAIKNNEFRSDK